MFKLGIVDRHFKNYHINQFTKLLHGSMADEGMRVVCAWDAEKLDEVADWCEKNEVRHANSAEEVAEEADAIMVLAPNDIDWHRRLAEKVLPYGKPTLIDKFLAPNLEDARAIVDLAAKHGAPIYSSSSLRYLDQMLPVLDQLSGPIDDMFVQGMGDWAGYGIHSVAPVIRAMGSDIQRITDTGNEDTRIVTVDYGGGRKALIEVRNCDDGYGLFPWRFGIREGKKVHVGQMVDGASLYDNMIRTAIKFFRTGQSDMSVKDMLAHVAVLETAQKSQDQGGVWLPMPL